MNKQKVIVEVPKEKPQTASQVNISSPEKKLRSVDSFQLVVRDEPFTAHAPQVTDLNDINNIVRRPHSACLSGVWGYRVPKPLQFSQGPKYTIPRDKSSYFDQETKEQRMNPGPGKYTLRQVFTPEQEKQMLKKRRQKVDIETLPKRPMFWDSDVKHAKNAPAPGQYIPKVINNKIKGSVAMKIERTSYIDDAVRMNQERTAPGQYTPKKQFFEKKVVGLKWHLPTHDQEKSAKKVTGPDVGSYDPGQSYKKISRQVQNTLMTKTKIMNFSSQIVKEKEFVPACGSYNPEKCYKAISRPGMRRRV